MDTPDPKEKPALTGADRVRAKVRRSIVTNSALSTPYFTMNGLATVVASYGLLANSTAVVIGAMIIATLLGPIMGLALSLVDGDTELMRKAVVAEATGVAAVVLIGGLIGRLHGDIQITNEIIVRTTPNLLDLAVALFGGAAGAYATASPRVNVGLVGVAISTALLPPLASCGICLFRGLYPQAGGAFVLFATNLVAIQCAASVVLYILGFHKIIRNPENDPNYVRRIVIDAVVLLSLAGFLYRQLANTVGDQQYQRELNRYLSRELKNIPGTYLADTQYVHQDQSLVVVAIVHTPFSISPQQTAEMQKGIRPYNGKRIELHIRSLITKETTADGYLHIIRPDAGRVEKPREGEDGTLADPGPVVVPDRDDLEKK